MNTPWIIASPLTPDPMPVTDEPGGLAGLILGSQSGPPVTVEAYYLDNNWDEDWHPAPAPFLLLAGEQVRLGRTAEEGITLLNVLDTAGALTGSAIPGKGKYVVVVQPDESRSLTLSLPSGANGLHVRTVGGRGDIDLVLRNPSNQNQGAANYTGSVTGNNEGFFVFQAGAGNWTVRLDEAGSKVASAFLIIGFDPPGALPAESTLTTTDTPQALTIPAGAEIVRYTIASGSARVSTDGGTTFGSPLNAPVSYTITPEQAAALLFITGNSSPATINYLPYVRTS